MFRMDKRSKRQKVLLAVVLTSLLVGVISFGIVLSVSASSKKALIKDSKEILAVFDMGYKKAVTPSLPPDEPAAKAGTAAVAGQPGGAAPAKKPAQVSQIADQLSVLVRKKRTASKSASAATVQRGPLNAEQEAAAVEALRKKKAQEEAAARAAEMASLGMKGRGEESEAVLVGEVLSAKDVRKMCRDRSGELLACGKKFGGEAGFSLKLTINTNGRIVKSVASVDGATNGDLGGCVQTRLGNARLNAPKEETTYDCKVE
jgi:hypothetical protein